MTAIARGVEVPAAARAGGAASAAADRRVLLELRDTSVRYGGVHALRSATLRVREGERIALLGHNGSGKTTLLRVLHGLQPCAGERQVLADVRQAMVFQRPFLLRLSVRSNMRLALWLAGVAKDEREERARAALRRVGLEDASLRPARALSGGQQQRVALARAWAVRPQLLFLDEPTASLDPGAKREVESLIDEFAAEGMTVVMSTHNLGQAKRLATRVIYLEDGRIVADLPTAQFFAGEVPEQAMHFLRGELP